MVRVEIDATATEAAHPTPPSHSHRPFGPQMKNKLILRRAVLAILLKRHFPRTVDNILLFIGRFCFET